jgi:DNA-binding FadR family transcriptional regulator
VLAAVAGNPVLELLALVLIRLTVPHGTAPVGAPGLRATEEVIDVHQRIVEAILAGDHELARHRMRRHLDALVDWMR